MRYLNLKGKETIYNGRAVLAVTGIKTAKTKTEGRLAKIFLINEIIAPSPGNQIWPGQLLALSFPEDKINRKKYEWKAGEETQVPFRIDMPPPPPKTRIIYG